MSRQNLRGFTLIEILVVVVILGVLASIVIAQVGSSNEDARKQTFITQLKAFVRAEAVHRENTGRFLEKAGSGVIPAGFADYINRQAWERPTPIGGVWESELNDNGITSGIGVHFNNTGINRDDAFMQSIDAILDDGSLGSGRFRKLAADRFYWVIED